MKNKVVCLIAVFSIALSLSITNGLVFAHNSVAKQIISKSGSDKSIWHKGGSVAISDTKQNILAKSYAYKSKKLLKTLAEELPVSYDDRLVHPELQTPVKNQSIWGTCWAHGALESAQRSVSQIENAPEQMSSKHLVNATENLNSMIPAEGENSASQWGWNPHEAWNLGGIADMPMNAMMDHGVVPEANYQYPVFNVSRWKDDYEEAHPGEHDDQWKAQRVSTLYNDIANSISDTDNIHRNIPANLDLNGHAITDYEQEGGFIPLHNLKNPQKYVATDYSIRGALYDWDNYSEGIGAVNQDRLLGVKKMIKDKGIVAMSYGAMVPGDEYFDNHDSSQFIPPTAPRRDRISDHNVSVVGYDDTFPKEHFGNGDASDEPIANGAFIVKNSWGTGFGDHGYFYLSYYDASIADFASYDLEIGNYANVSKYDESGYTEGDWILPNQNSVWISNIFNAQNSNKLIDSITIPTVTNNMDVEVSIYSDVNRLNGPTSGIQIPVGDNSQISQKSHFDISGIHTIKLSHQPTIAQGHNYAVVVKLTTKSGDYTAFSTEWEHPYGYDSSIHNYVFDAKNFSFNTGESFISKDGQNFADFKNEQYDSVGTDELWNDDLGQFGNFNIRANEQISTNAPDVDYIDRSSINDNTNNNPSTDENVQPDTPKPAVDTPKPVSKPETTKPVDKPAASATVTKPTTSTKAILAKSVSVLVSKVAVGSNLKLQISDVKSLTYKLLPANTSNKKLTIKSSNAKVLSVSGSKITAKKVGFVTLEVKTTDGSGINKVINVTVFPKTPDLKALKFKLTALKKRKLKATWKSLKSQKISNIHIRIRKAGGKWTTYHFEPNKLTTFNFSKLVANKKYQVQIRTSVNLANSIFFSQWSKTATSSKIKK